MSRLLRALAYATAATTAVALGTFVPDRCAVGFHGLATILGVSITAVIVGRLWHASDAPTYCGFLSMVAGLASIRVAIGNT